MKKRRFLVSLAVAALFALGLFSAVLASAQTGGSGAQLTAADFAVKDNNGQAKGPGALFKPSLSGELLFWGSNGISAKNQTLKFDAALFSPTDNYDKSQFFFSLRASAHGNPWDAGETKYWIVIDNTSVIVRDGANTTIFKTDDDTYSSEPGYNDTRYALVSLIDHCETAADGSTPLGNRKAFYNRTHAYEVSAVNEAGGVRLSVKIDGTNILNWLDTNSTVDGAGGFSVRHEDVYEFTASSLKFTGDDGAEVNLLAAENTGKIAGNFLNVGGYVSPSQWAMPLMNGGMGTIFTAQELGDVTVDMDIKLDNPYDADTWFLNVFLRDPIPNKFPWDTADKKGYYQLLINKAGIEIHRKDTDGQDTIVDTLYFGLGAGTEWQYFSTPRHLKIVLADNADGNPEFTAYLDNASAAMTTAGGVDKAVDTAPSKVTTAGGVMIWGNNNIEKSGEGVYSRIYSVYINNLIVSGAAAQPDSPNDTAEMVNLISGNYMMDYYYGAAYSADKNAIVLGAHSNTGSVAYGESAMRNQYIDITLSNTKAEGWINQIYLRDKFPGYANWEKGSLGGGANATNYSLAFENANSVSLTAYVGGEATALSSGTLSGLTFENNAAVSLRIECEDNADGEPVIRVFGAQGGLLFKYVDKAKLVPDAGGFTLVSDTSAGKLTTITALSANAAYRDPTIFERPVDPAEPEADVPEMYDLVADSQILSSKHNVGFRADKIVLGGAPSAASGDISRIYAPFAQGAAVQTVELKLKYTSLCVTGTETVSDWLGSVMLLDNLPGAAAWDTERGATPQGSGAYMFTMAERDITVRRVLSTASQDMVTSFVLPEDFWLAAHTLRLETYVEDGYTLIKLFVDGVYTYRMVDGGEQRLTSGKGFTFISKVAAEVSELSANAVFVEKPAPFDLAQCEGYDFADLMEDTYDWNGQIRSNNAGKTVFYGNGLELLEGSDKNAGYVKKDASFTNFYLDFNLRLTLSDAFIQRGVGDWIFMLSFRDDNPTKNAWDAATKNAYILVFTLDPAADSASNGAVVLRRFNNTPSSFGAGTDLASMGGLPLTAAEGNGFRIAAYNEQGGGVRVGVWMNDTLLFDVVDDDVRAVKTGGTFMIGQHGTVQDSAVSIVKSLMFTGFKTGVDRPVYVLGVNEPKPEGAQLYPEGEYDEPGIGKLVNTAKNCGSVSAAELAAFLAVLSAALSFALIKRS